MIVVSLFVHGTPALAFASVDTNLTPVDTLQNYKNNFSSLPVKANSKLRYVDLLIRGCTTSLWSSFWSERAWLVCLGGPHAHFAVLEKKIEIMHRVYAQISP